MSDVHESEVLLAVMREDWDEAAARIAAHPPVAATFLALARECEVEAWLHYRLKAASRIDLLGAEVRAGLEAARRRCRDDNIVLLAALEPAIDLLLANGIVPVLLKGTDVIHQFPIPFDARSMSDADLLIPRADVMRALALFESAGWRLPPEPARTHWLRSSYEMPLYSPGRVKVLLEIHWSLGQTGRYAIDDGALLARAAPLEVGGRRVLRLDGHDAAAHLLLHHLQHYFDRTLKWAVDLHRITKSPGFSWETLGRRLEEWGGRVAAGISLLHLRKLFPDWFPDARVSGLPAPAWRRALCWPLRSGHPLDYYRGTRRRPVQLWLAAAYYENPARLAGYLAHRRVRDRLPSTGPDGPGNAGDGAP